MPIKFINDDDTIIEKVQCKGCNRYFEKKYFTSRLYCVCCIPLHHKKCRECRSHKF